jgi:hypothetical protein
LTSASGYTGAAPSGGGTTDQDMSKRSEQAYRLKKMEQLENIQVCDVYVCGLGLSLSNKFYFLVGLV